MEGKFEKLEIQSYVDAKFTKKGVDEMKATINPEEFSEKYENKYSKEQAVNSTGSPLKFKYGIPQKFDFKLVFDGTGVVSSAQSFGTSLLGSKDNTDVTEQIEKLKKICIEYDGGEHQPKYTQIVWGKSIFQGRVTNLDITYTLFKPNGTPIRAKVLLSLLGSIERKAELAKQDKQSPDLTHIRIVHESETLAYQTHKIYGDSGYYLEVARVNRLSHFRRLKTGSKLRFPPLDKTSNG